MHQNQIKIHYKNDIINIGNLDQRFAFFYYTKIYSRLYPDIIFSDLNIEETTKGRIFNYYPYKETSDQELETFIKSKEFGNDQTILSLLEKISVLNSNEKIFSILRHIVKLEKNRIIYNLIENLCIQAIGEIDIYSSRAKEELYFKKPTHNPNNFITNYSYQKIKEIQDKTSCFNMAYYDLVWILNLPIFSFFLEKYHNNLKITEDLITLEISPLFLSQKNWKTKISDEFLKISNEIDFERKKTTTIQALNNLEEKINHFSFPCFNDFINFKDVGFNDTSFLINAISGNFLNMQNFTYRIEDYIDYVNTLIFRLKIKTTLPINSLKKALSTYLTYLNVEIESEDLLNDFICSFFDIENEHTTKNNYFNFIPKDKAIEFTKFIFYIKNLKLIQSNKTDIIKGLEKNFHKKGNKDGFSYRSLMNIDCEENNPKNLIPNDDIRRKINSILKYSALP